ncbi:unnamed protein product (mitochondrion) [Musa textilis]
MVAEEQSMNELCYVKNVLNHLKSKFADKLGERTRTLRCTYTMMDDRSLTERVGAPPTYEVITEVPPSLPGDHRCTNERPNNERVNGKAHRLMDVIKRMNGNLTFNKELCHFRNELTTFALLLLLAYHTR